MPVTIPLEVYEEFEKGLGKEGAKKVIKGLESVISEATEYKWKVTKDELLDAIRKEFVTRELFEERMGLLGEKINTLRAELEGKIEKEILRLDRKFTIMFIILFFTIIFFNQNALEFLARVLGLIK